MTHVPAILVRVDERARPYRAWTFHLTGPEAINVPFASSDNARANSLGEPDVICVIISSASSSNICAELYQT